MHWIVIIIVIVIIVTRGRGGIIFGDNLILDVIPIQPYEVDGEK